MNNSDGLPQHRLSLGDVVLQREREGSQLPSPGGSAPGLGDARKDHNIKLTDYPKALGMGAASIVDLSGDVAGRAADYLEDKGPVGKVYSTLFRAPEAVGNLAGRVSEGLEGSLSEDAQAARALPMFDTDDEGAIGSLRFGDGAKELDVVALKLSEAIGSLIPTAGVGGVAGRAVTNTMTKALLKKGYTPGQAEYIAGRALAEKAGRVAGATTATEIGTTAYMGGAGRSISEGLAELPVETRIMSESGRRIYQQVAQEEEWKARSPLEQQNEVLRRQEQELTAAAMFDPKTIALGAAGTLIGDVGLMRMVAGAGKAAGIGAGKAGSAAQGFAMEGITEGVQGGAQTYMTNQRLIDEAGSDAAPMSGVIAGALEEGLLGGAAGGAVGAYAGHRNNQARNQQSAADAAAQEQIDEYNAQNPDASVDPTQEPQADDSQPTDITIEPRLDEADRPQVVPSDDPRVGKAFSFPPNSGDVYQIVENVDGETYRVANVNSGETLNINAGNLAGQLNVDGLIAQYEQNSTETRDATPTESDRSGQSPAAFDERAEIPAYLRQDTDIDGREVRPNWSDDEAQQALSRGESAPTVEDLVRQQQEQGPVSEAEPEQMGGDIETWQPNWRAGRQERSQRQQPKPEPEYIPLQADASAGQETVVDDDRRLESPAIDAQGVEIDESRGLGYNRTINMGGEAGDNQFNSNYVPPLTERQDRSVEPQSMRDSRTGVGKALQEAGQESDAIWQQLSSLRVTKRGKPFASEKEAKMASRKDEQPVKLPEGYGVAKSAEVAEVDAEKASATPEQREQQPAKQTQVAGGAIAEVSVDSLKLSNDVPQFKDGANSQGVVEALGGKFDRTGVAPIQVWQRSNGDMEVISGRHRLDLARRSGEQTIPAQVHKESDGFGRAAAATLDAELNIRDNQGKVKDYVQYFQATGIERAEADRRGYTARALGRRAYEIATSGSEETIAAHSAGQLTDEAAERIVTTAPSDARLQAVGLKAIQDGKSITHATNMMQAVKALTGGQQGDGMGDMFGFDDSGMREAEQMATLAAKKQREISELLRPQKAVANSGKLAAQEGITDKLSAEQRKARMDNLQSLKTAWDTWSTNPELVAELRREIQGDEAPALSSYSEADLQQQADQIKQAQQTEQEAQSRYDADQDVDSFNLAGSDAPADIAMAQGQQDIFAEPTAEASKAESNQVAESELIDRDLLKHHADKWSYRYSVGGSWRTASKESAVDSARQAYAKAKASNELPPTREQRNEKADADLFSDLDGRYGKLSLGELTQEYQRLGGVASELAEAGKGEFNGGGRRTGAAVASEGARQTGDERLRLGAYIAMRQERGGQVSAHGVTVAVPKLDPSLVDAYNRATHLGRGRDINAELQAEAQSLLDSLNEKKHTLTTVEQKQQAGELITDYLNAKADFHKWDAAAAARNPSWLVTGRDGRNMNNANTKNEKHMDQFVQRVEKLERQRNAIANQLYRMRPDSVKADQQMSTALRDVAQVVGDIASMIRDGKPALEKETRGWASPKAHKLISKAVEQDKARTISQLLGMNTQLHDVGGLVKVLGPRSNAGKLVSELLAAPSKKNTDKDNQKTEQGAGDPQPDTAFRIESTDTNVLVYGEPESIRRALRANDIPFPGAEFDGGLSFGKKQEGRIRQALAEAGQVTEQAGDAPAFSTRKGSKYKKDPLSAAALKDTVNTFFQRYKGADDVSIEYHETAETLPGYNAERDQGAVIEGQYDYRTDTLHLVRSAFDGKNQVEAALREEILVHKGLGFFSPVDRQQLYSDIQQAAKDSAEIKALWDKTVADYQDIASSHKLTEEEASRLYAEEMLGSLAQRKVNWLKRGWNTLWRGIKRLLVNAGWAKATIGEAELRSRIDLIANAFEQGKRARRRHMGADIKGGIDLFSRTTEAADSNTSPTPEPENAYDRAYRTLGNKDKGVMEQVKNSFKRNFTAAGLLPDAVYKQKIVRDSELNIHEFDVAHYVGALDRAVNKAYGKSYHRLTDAQREAIDRQMKSTTPDLRLPAKVREALMDMRRSIAGLSQEYVNTLQQQLGEMESGMSEGERILLGAFHRMSEIESTGNSPTEKAAATRKRNQILDDAKVQAKEAGVGNMQSALMAVGAVAEKQGLIRTIMNNMDTYAHRSYRAFDNPNWPKEVSKEVFDRAVNYLESRYVEQGQSKGEAEQSAIRTTRTILEEGTAYEGMEAFIKESKLGAKDLSTLKRRKEISPEIRDLLGEYKDAKINYSKTISKMSQLVANTKLLERIKQIGLDDGWLYTEENKPLDQSVTKIAGDSSEVYAPLNGYYVPNDIHQAMKDALGKEQMADWLRTIIRMNGMVKYGKTVLSPTTAFRNFMSASFFAMANGHFDMSQMRKSAAVINGYFSGDKDKGKMEYLRKLKGLGVIYDSPYAGEMMDLLADSRLEETIFNKRPLQGLKAASEFAQKFYQFGDDFWKVLGFENEKALLMKHKGMSDADAEVEAAERIRNTYPTYSMTGRMVNHLRRFPLAGTFVSFPAEIIRTSYHMLRYLKQDMKESKPYAMRKAFGLAAVSGLAYAMQALTKDLFDVGDDEEEAVRKMGASWNQNANLMFMGRDEDGNLRYLDLSFLDAYNYFKRPINAILRDQPIKDALLQSAGELSSPFFGTDIAAGAINEVLNNKRESGARVFNPEDTVAGQAQDIANHLRKALQPGFASNIERAIKAANSEVSASGKKYKAEEEVAAFFGFRATTFDPKTALYYKSFEFKDRKRDATGLLLDVAKNPNSVSDRELKSAYKTASNARLKAYREMVVLVEAAKRSGMTRTQIVQSLKTSGVGQQDINYLLQGRIPDWRLDGRTMRNTIKKAEMLYGPEVVKAMRDRERAILSRGWQE